jgi:hypothetical protein
MAATRIVKVPRGGCGHRLSWAIAAGDKNPLVPFGKTAMSRVASVKI